jgi:hypothetical protein
MGTLAISRGDRASADIRAAVNLSDERTEYLIRDRGSETIRRGDGGVPGFMASRRNYDVAQGIGADGRARSGMLEPSWRIGGASSAELGALAAFARDPSWQIIRASPVEAYGKGHRAPSDAVVEGG